MHKALIYINEVNIRFSKKLVIQFTRKEKQSNVKNEAAAKLF